MSHKYFTTVPQISYEGSKAKSPFAFKHYGPDELVEGKTIREHLHFAVNLPKLTIFKETIA